MFEVVYGNTTFWMSTSWEWDQFRHNTLGRTDYDLLGMCNPTIFFRYLNHDDKPCKINDDERLANCMEQIKAGRVLRGDKLYLDFCQNQV